LSSGSVTITPRTYNYNKIVRNLDKLPEKDILELLKTPAYPNGIFELYSYTNTLLVYHISLTANTIHILKNNKLECIYMDITPHKSPDCELLGVYSSEEDIVKDFPEYFL
jgi:hypothetical protein